MTYVCSIFGHSVRHSFRHSFRHCSTWNMTLDSWPWFMTLINPTRYKIHDTRCRVVVSANARPTTGKMILAPCKMKHEPEFREHLYLTIVNNSWFLYSTAGCMIHEPCRPQVAGLVVRSNRTTPVRRTHFFTTRHGWCCCFLWRSHV